MSILWEADHRRAGLPIEYQGMRGTCLSMAVTSGRRRTSDFSAEYAHFMSESFGGRGKFESVQHVLAQKGQPPEPQWPYDPTIDEADPTYSVPSGVTGPFASARLAVDRLLPTFDEVRQRTASGGALVLGIRVLDTLYVPDGGLVLPARIVPQAHAVLCVGTATFDGATSGALPIGEPLVCFQNSWGAQWGDGGYGYLPESTFTLAALKVAEVQEP